MQKTSYAQAQIVRKGNTGLDNDINPCAYETL